MVVPRGRYSIDMYEKFVKLHGSTHDYKILYKDINRAFMLPKTDGIHMMYVLALNTPLRHGNTSHYYIIFQFKKEEEVSIALNQRPD